MFEFLTDTNKISVFFLIVMRISGIMFTAPIFSSEAVSARIKLFFQCSLDFLFSLFVPLVDFSKSKYFAPNYIICKELLIGIATGLIGRFLFVGVQFGGQIIGTQMGFGIVNVLDPQSNSQVSLIAQFQNILMVLFFSQ